MFKFWGGSREIFNLQQRITDSKQDSLSQEVLVELSSKAGANKGKQTDGSSRKHESTRAVFVKDGADDGATEEENEELVVRERIVSIDLTLLCFSFLCFALMNSMMLESLFVCLPECYQSK